jgi:hypothetical protein
MHHTPSEPQAQHQQQQQQQARLAHSWPPAMQQIQPQLHVSAASAAAAGASSSGGGGGGGASSGVEAGHVVTAVPIRRPRSVHALPPSLPLPMADAAGKTGVMMQRRTPHPAGVPAAGEKGQGERGQ